MSSFEPPPDTSEAKCPNLSALGFEASHYGKLLPDLLIIYLGHKSSFFGKDAEATGFYGAIDLEELDKRLSQLTDKDYRRQYKHPTTPPLRTEPKRANRDQYDNEPQFHDYLVREGGRPAYPIKLLPEIFAKPEQYAEILLPWQPTPGVEHVVAKHVFAEQMARWREFRRWQRQTRYDPENKALLKMRGDWVRAKLQQHNVESTLDCRLCQDPDQQDIVTTWLEYLSHGYGKLDELSQEWEVLESKTREAGVQLVRAGRLRRGPEDGRFRNNVPAIPPSEAQNSTIRRYFATWISLAHEREEGTKAREVESELCELRMRYKQELLAWIYNYGLARMEEILRKEALHVPRLEWERKQLPLVVNENRSSRTSILEEETRALRTSLLDLGSACEEPTTTEIAETCPDTS